MSEMPESRHAYQGGLHTECGTNPRERCMLLATKWEQWRRHLSPLKLLKFHQDPQIAGIGLENFVFSLPIFSRALVFTVP